MVDEIEKSFVERRGWPRTIIHEVIDEAKVQFAPESEEGTPPAEVVNLSIAGAGVLLPIRLKKGMQVRLQILGKNLPKLALEAEVRWSAESPVATGKYPTGLKFLPLEQQRRAQLQAFIEMMRKHRPVSE